MEIGTRNRSLVALLIVAGMVSSCQKNAANAPVDPLLRNDERNQTISEMYRDYRDEFPEIGEVTAEELLAWRTTRNVLIVDVREENERAVSIIPGAISKEEFESRGPVSADETVVVYCTIGYRSGKYVQELQEKGIPAYNLEGSLLAWTHADGDVVDSKGAPTKKVHVYGKKWDLLPEGYESMW